MQILKIEMIHDLVCSWCHIGSHNIAQALERLSNEVSAEFHYLPFQLNPDLEPQGADITEHLCQRYGWSLDQAMTYREKLLATTREVGVIIDFSKRTRYYNTANAHRLILAAEQEGLQRQVHQALLQAYHVEGENINDRDVLVKTAVRVGLSEKWVNAAITSQTASEQMAVLSQRIGQYEVRSVPAFIFNETRFVSGSNSADYFEQLIRTEFLANELIEG